MSKETCSDRKPSASEASRHTAGLVPEGTTSPQIVDPAGQVDGLDASFKKMFPASEDGPSGGESGTVLPAGRTRTK